MWAVIWAILDFYVAPLHASADGRFNGGPGAQNLVVPWFLSAWGQLNGQNPSLQMWQLSSPPDCVRGCQRAYLWCECEALEMSPTWVECSSGPGQPPQGSTSHSG